MKKRTNLWVDPYKKKSCLENDPNYNLAPSTKRYRAMNECHHTRPDPFKVVNIPNTVIGVAFGGIGKLVDWNEQICFGHNGIEFIGNPLCLDGGAITFGNAMNFSTGGWGKGTFYATGPENGLLDPQLNRLDWTYADHEMQHTYQSQVLGPLFLPVYGAAMIGTLISDPYSDGMLGGGNFMERGPYYPEHFSQPPQMWP